MKLLLKIMLISLSFLTETFNAQELQLGFRFEANGVKAQSGSESLSFTASPLGFEINASLFPIEELAIEARAAIIIVEYLNGTEAGLFARYYFDKPFYLIAGVISHKMMTKYFTTEGLGSWYPNKAVLTLPAIGAGINLPFREGDNSNFKFDLELMYEFTGNKSTGYKIHNFYDNLRHSEEEIFVPLELSYAIKISLGVSFIL